MNPDITRKPFPLPVVALGAGSQAEDDTLAYLPMPSGMDTYRPPVLPEPAELQGQPGARQVLQQALAALAEAAAGRPAPPVPLQGLAPDAQALLNQVLGEGEVSARVNPAPGQPGGAQRLAQVLVQESVFAGLWRVVQVLDDGARHEWLEAATLPAALCRAALEDASPGPAAPPPAPEGVMNAPLLLTELHDQQQRWPQRAGAGDRQAHVINLTLLPMTPLDIGWLDQQLGTGRVVVLSRGYGNCRITNTCQPHTWRVVYYNSQDTVILNTVEVCAVPEVACAAAEDLADSHERLAEVLQWLDQG